MMITHHPEGLEALSPNAFDRLAHRSRCILNFCASELSGGSCLLQDRGRGRRPCAWILWHCPDHLRRSLSALAALAKVLAFLSPGCVEVSA